MRSSTKSHISFLSGLFFSVFLAGAQAPSGLVDFTFDTSSAPVFDLRLTNCTFDNVSDGNIVKNVKNATLDNVKINGRVIDALA